MNETLGERNYEDFLKRVDSLGGELSWISQRRNFPQTSLNGDISQKRNPSDIVRDVLTSNRLKTEIQMQASKRGVSQSVVEDEAKQILFTMAHQMHLLSVRGVGYAVIKVLKTLLDAIYVNVRQLSSLKGVFRSNPVVFMPTHRSYLDFLLMSVLCFDQEIPLPAIASAMDFMYSKLIGETLRRCGAFFIRRRVGKDRLYWAVFTEYIQTHITNADHPLEFFIEGTRSRCNKSLYPKFGLLQILLEPFFRRQIYDVVVIPVTIDYDKVIEECLFACESLGFSKPKESASGLFKARRVLNNRYGRVFMTFGKAISVRHYFRQLVSSLPCCNSEAPAILTDEEKTAVKKFGHFIVQCQNSMGVVCVWPYISFLLLQIFEEKRLLKQPVETTVRHLMGLLEEFIGFAQQLGKRVTFVDGLREDLLYSLELHADLFENRLNGLDSVLRPVVHPVNCSKLLAKNLVEEAVTYVSLWCYSSQISHDFVDVGLLCSIFQFKQIFPIGRCMHYYCSLREMLDYEFVLLCDSETLHDSFSETVALLMKNNIIAGDGKVLHAVDFDKIRFLASFVEPYLSSYMLFLETASCFAGSVIAGSLLVQGTQSRIAARLTTSSKSRIRLQCLSAEPIKNALNSFSAKGALIKQGENEYFVNDMRIRHFTETIRSVTSPNESEDLVVQSKL